MNDNAFRRLVMAQMNKLMEASGSGDAFDLPSMINAIVDARGAAEPRPMSEAPRAEVERLRWRRIDGPGVDGQRVMLRELDPFDSLNRGDENRDVIASGYWSDDCGYYVWPFGCTDHPPTHWAPMPDRLTDERKGGGA